MSYLDFDFPHTRFFESDLRELIKQVFIMNDLVTNFVSINAIKYADPIQWDITKSYEKNTVVIDGNSGVAYISVRPVPSGVALTREQYWTKVFDLSVFITKGAANFARSYEEQPTTTATMSTNEGEWVVWDTTLYKALTNIHPGDRYVPDGNIRRMAVEDFYDALKSIIDNEVHEREAGDDALELALNEETEIRGEADSALHQEIIHESVDRENADIALQENIDAEATTRENADNAINTKIGNLANLQTSNKSSIVNAINSLVAYVNDVDYVTPEDFGAIGDGVTDDTQAVQAAISDGRPVKFINDYAITKIHFTYGLSTRFLDGGEHYLNSLDSTKTPVEFCGGGTLIYRLGIRQHNQINEPPALYWYSENGGASNFNIFYDLRFDYCYHCIKYGDGTETAQSENRIIGMFTYSCSRMVTLHGRLLQLWIDDAVLNASQFPSQGNMASMIEVTRGSILFIDNSTIENVGYEQQSGIVSTGECYINNCVLEIAGINLACFREANGVDNDGLLSMTNSRAYQGGTAKDFLDIAMGGNCVIQNCYILKMSPANFFFYHNPTSGTRISLLGVKCEGGLLPTGNFPNLMLAIENSTFNNLKRITGGYMTINNSNIPSPSGELPVWDNTVYGNYEATINNINSSSYVGTTDNYLLLAGGTVGHYKGAFIYTAPNHSVGILNNYMTEYGSTITGGLSYT